MCFLVCHKPVTLWTDIVDWQPDEVDKVSC